MFAIHATLVLFLEIQCVISRLGVSKEIIFMNGVISTKASAFTYVSSLASFVPGMGLEVLELVPCFHASLGVIERACNEGDDAGSTPLT